MFASRLSAGLLLQTLPWAVSAASDFNTQCLDFANVLRTSANDNLSNATIWFTETIAAGTNLSLPDYDPSCGDQWQAVGADLCRVAMFVPTSNQSNISTEVWLPTPEAWTGRFLSTGNGGVSGCIQYYDLAYTTQMGFSAVATNNGHNGTSGVAFSNAEILEDFVFRAMHTGVVLGKEISNLFYGQEYTKSYYFGCSTGGRQGFKAAQDFPDDFDGWSVGAPAVSQANLTTWSASFYAEEGNSSAATYVSNELWLVVHDDILAQCDALDGYVDGIIEEASVCHYTPSSAILCSSNNTTVNASSCLTDPQASTVRKFLSPLINSESNSLVYPAMQPGSEIAAAEIYYTGTSFSYSDDWFRYVVWDDPTWNPAAFNATDMTAAAVQNPFNVQTWKGNLSAVQDKGSKILHYHGQQDPIISSYNSPRYYEHVAATMNKTHHELDEFYRFFRISGMGHCSGGPGASFIGQAITSNWTENPEGNVLTALVRWVEEGIAPDTILGTAYVNETQSTGEVAFQRRHCRYPYRNVYTGEGDPTEPDSWECIFDDQGDTI